jgi:Fanconi anemia group J protein
MLHVLSVVITQQVSEGIDFADGRARCVMVVGIPYPHAKDSKVNLKKEYNNATAAASARATAAAARQAPYGSSSRSKAGPPPRLLTGDAWYSQQAFRALNQVRGCD